jgi:hypothetical protein
MSNPKYAKGGPGNTGRKQPMKPTNTKSEPTIIQRISIMI